eukprot:4593463-Prymnesium_polylepis.1
MVFGSSLAGRKGGPGPTSYHTVALVQLKKCELSTEVLTIHTTFDTKNAPVEHFWAQGRHLLSDHNVERPVARDQL